MLNHVFFKAVKQVCNTSIFNTLAFEISCNTDKLLLFHGHCMKLTYTFPGCAMLCGGMIDYAVHLIFIFLVLMFRDNAVNIGGEKPVKKLKVI